MPTSIPSLAIIRCVRRSRGISYYHGRRSRRVEEISVRKVSRYVARKVVSARRESKNFVVADVLVLSRRRLLLFLL